MKKLIALALGATLLLSGCGGSNSATSEAEEKYGSATLKLYNIWVKT